MVFLNARDKLEREEEQRLIKQKEELGKDGIEAAAKNFEAAIAKNVNPPSEVMYIMIKRRSCLI